MWSQANVSGLQRNVVSKGACIRFQRYIRNTAGEACFQLHLCQNFNPDAVLNPVVFVPQQFRERPVQQQDVIRPEVFRQNRRCEHEKSRQLASGRSSDTGMEVSSVTAAFVHYRSLMLTIKV